MDKKKIEEEIQPLFYERLRQRISKHVDVAYNVFHVKEVGCYAPQKCFIYFDHKVSLLFEKNL